LFALLLNQSINQSINQSNKSIHRMDWLSWLGWPGETQRWRARDLSYGLHRGPENHNGNNTTYDTSQADSRGFAPLLRCKMQTDMWDK
jgi:hypothetical protein